MSEFPSLPLVRTITSPSAPVVFPPTKCEAVLACWQVPLGNNVSLVEINGDTPVPFDKAPLLLQLLPGKVLEPGSEHAAGIADGVRGGGCTQVPGEAPDAGPCR